jgi:hypothetical protein
LEEILVKTMGMGSKRALRFSSLLSLALPLALAGGCAGTKGSTEADGLCTEGRSAHSVGELSALAKVIQAGTRTAMLAGDGLTVRDFVQNLQQSSTGVSVAIYASNGEHVYAPTFPPPSFSSLPPNVQEIIRNGSPTKPANGRLSFALANEDRCKGCHPSGTIRAVMTMQLAKEQLAPAPTPDAMVPFGTIVEAAFQAMMTLGKASAADEFMQALPKEVPGVLTASVFSRDGRASLGDGFMEVPPEIVKRALTPTKPFATEMKDGTLVAVPLPNSHRCLSCHKPSEMRGAIMLKLDKKLMREETAKFLLTSSVQHVMLTGLGRLSKKFLNEAAKSGLFSDLTVHDAEGRLFHDVHFVAHPPEMIAQVLRTGQGTVVQGKTKDDLTVVVPVANDDKCRRCHDEPGAVRAVIAVTGSRPLGPAAAVPVPGPASGPASMAHVP